MRQRSDGRGRENRRKHMRDACNGGRVEAVQRGCTRLGIATRAVGAQKWRRTDGAERKLGCAGRGWAWRSSGSSPLRQGSLACCHHSACGCSSGPPAAPPQRVAALRARRPPAAWPPASGPDPGRTGSACPATRGGSPAGRVGGQGAGGQAQTGQVQAGGCSCSRSAGAAAAAAALCMAGGQARQERRRRASGGRAMACAISRQERHTGAGVRHLPACTAGPAGCPTHAG